MKKTLLFLFVAILFASCSSDNDTTLPDNSAKMHKMTFNVSGFKITSEPISRLATTKALNGDYLQYVIYQEDGTPIINKTLQSAALTSTGTDSVGVKIEEELLVGKYHIAVLTAYRYPNTSPIFDPKNLETDVCMGNRWITKNTGNDGIFFESLSYEVSENIANEALDIKLEPMWSTVRIKVANAATCYIPKDANSVTYYISPSNIGFNIKDKKPAKRFEYQAGGQYDYIGSTSFRSGDENVCFYTTESEDVTIKVRFFEQSETVLEKVWAEHDVYKGSIEKGQNITLTGTLPEGSTSTESKFNISSGKMEDVEIPFTK